MLQTGRTVTCLYMYDAIGNPLALTSNTSVTNLALEYDRHGAANRTDGGGLTGASALNPFEFQGGVQDRVTRQVKFGGRWYNPATGSWTAQDTLNAPLDPSNADRYVYAADDPINNAGLAGHGIVGDFVDAIGDFGRAVVRVVLTALPTYCYVKKSTEAGENGTDSFSSALGDANDCLDQFSDYFD